MSPSETKVTRPFSGFGEPPSPPHPVAAASSSETASERIRVRGGSWEPRRASARRRARRSSRHARRPSPPREPSPFHLASISATSSRISCSSSASASSVAATFASAVRRRSAARSDRPRRLAALPTIRPPRGSSSRRPWPARPHRRGPGTTCGHRRRDGARVGVSLRDGGGRGRCGRTRDALHQRRDLLLRQRPAQVGHRPARREERRLPLVGADEQELPLREGAKSPQDRLLRGRRGSGRDEAEDLVPCRCARGSRAGPR